jgi:hypothetical protein
MFICYVPHTCVISCKVLGKTECRASRETRFVQCPANVRLSARASRMLGLGFISLKKIRCHIRTYIQA